MPSILWPARLLEFGGYLATALAVKVKLKLEHLIDDQNPHLINDAVVDDT